MFLVFTDEQDWILHVQDAPTGWSKSTGRHSMALGAWNPVNCLEFKACLTTISSNSFTHLFHLCPQLFSIQLFLTAILCHATWTCIHKWHLRGRPVVCTTHSFLCIYIFICLNRWSLVPTGLQPEEFSSREVKLVVLDVVLLIIVFRSKCPQCLDVVMLPSFRHENVNCNVAWSREVGQS